MEGSMRSRFRLLSIVVLALLLLALPSSGLAADPRGPARQAVSGLHGSIEVGPNFLSLVPGASVRTLGLSDAVAYSPSAGATVVTTYVPASELDYEYNSQGSYSILASLGLPAGATLWQIDVYGYTTGATTQQWGVYDQTGSGSFSLPTTMTMDTSTGPGLVHAALTFPSGVTLATGHEWFVDLFVTSSSSGFVGAYVQYTLPTLSFVPITPVRLLDSRNGNGMPGGTAARLRANTPFTFQITGRGGVPAYAKAVTGNLTVTDQTSAWAVYLGPNATASPTSSTINFVAGEVIANGVTVALSPTGTLSATYISTSGQTTNLVFDVTGYYQ
jgi:hypothetical protein